MPTIPLEKLENILERSKELEKLLSGELSSEEYVTFSKEYSEIEPLKNTINDWKSYSSEVEGLNEIINEGSSDAEMQELAKTELIDLKDRIEKAEETIQLMLLPKDEADSFIDI